MLKIKNDKLALGIRNNGANIIQKAGLEHFSLIKQISEVHSFSCMQFKSVKRQGWETGIWLWLSYYVSTWLVALVMSDSLRPCGLEPAMLLSPWDSSGKSTGVCCQAILQGIFPAQGSKLCLLHYRWIAYHWATGEVTY